MKIKVRTANRAVKVMEVSKAMLAQQFRKKVFKAVRIEPKQQRLLFRGKQLEPVVIFWTTVSIMKISSMSPRGSSLRRLTAITLARRRMPKI